LTVGRLEFRKGHDLLLRAFAEVRRRHPDARFVIVGDGEARPQLETLAREIGVGDAVHFVGRVEEPMLVGLYRRADIFWMASRADAVGQEEGLGLVFLEAAAAATPSIGTRVGGVADAIVDEETGMLVEPDSPSALAAAACRLLADPRECLAMGTRAHRRVRARYDWRRNVLVLRTELQTLIGENRDGRQQGA